MMKKNDVFDARFWKILLLFCIGIVVIILLPYFLTKSWTDIDFSTTGEIGDTIGGIMGPFIAIASALLTFLAFWIQYKANEQLKNDMKNQETRYEKERIENKFFEMVKIHRENVAELTYTSYSAKYNEKIRETALGRKVFKVIYSDFKHLWSELSNYLIEKTYDDIYMDNYLEKLKKNDEISIRSIDGIEYAKLDILYTIIFLGCGKDDEASIIKMFEGRYKKEFVHNLLLLTKVKPKVESEFWESWISLFKTTSGINILQNYNDFLGLNLFENCKQDFDKGRSDFIIQNYSSFTYDKYYGGHQFRLGHYFRHLYQAINYIDNSPNHSYLEKYEQVKILRGQMSSFEQILFFLNSVSIFGRIWELEDKKCPDISISKKKHLITKYNLIKNISNSDITDNINVENYYPDIKFEAFGTKFNIERRRKLEEIYNS